MMTSGLTRFVPSCLRGLLSVTVVAAIVSIWLTSPPTVSAEIYTGDPINLELAGADLKDVLVSMSEVTGFVFVVDPQTVAEGGLDRSVTAMYDSVPWDQALAEILVEAGLEWTVEGKVLWIHFPAYGPAGDRNFTGDAINLRLEKAKLSDVLSNMAQVTGLDIDFDPAVDTTVSVSLRNVPWDQVLDLILRISGFEYSLDGQELIAVKVSDTKGMQLGPRSQTTTLE